MKRLTQSSLWQQSASEAFCTAVVDFVQRHGAVNGILNRMEQLGLGAIARSWLDSDVQAPIFSEQLHALFGTSALYHRVNWQPTARRWMRRLDRSMIYVLIASSYTPFALLALAPR